MTTSAAMAALVAREEARRDRLREEHRSFLVELNKIELQLAQCERQLAELADLQDAKLRLDAALVELETMRAARAADDPSASRSTRNGAARPAELKRLILEVANTDAGRWWTAEDLRVSIGNGEVRHLATALYDLVGRGKLRKRKAQSGVSGGHFNEYQAVTR